MKQHPTPLRRLAIPVGMALIAGLVAVLYPWDSEAPLIPSLGNDPGSSEEASPQSIPGGTAESDGSSVRSDRVAATTGSPGVLTVLDRRSGEPVPDVEILRIAPSGLDPAKWSDLLFERVQGYVTSPMRVYRGCAESIHCDGEGRTPLAGKHRGSIFLAEVDGGFGWVRLGEGDEPPVLWIEEPVRFESRVRTLEGTPAEGHSVGLRCFAEGRLPRPLGNLRTDARGVVEFIHLERWAPAAELCELLGMAVSFTGALNLGVAVQTQEFDPRAMDDPLEFTLEPYSRLDAHLVGSDGRRIVATGSLELRFLGEGAPEGGIRGWFDAEGVASFASLVPDTEFEAVASIQATSDPADSSSSLDSLLVGRVDGRTGSAGERTSLVVELEAKQVRVVGVAIDATSQSPMGSTFLDVSIESDGARPRRHRIRTDDAGGVRLNLWTRSKGRRDTPEATPDLGGHRNLVFRTISGTSKDQGDLLTCRIALPEDAGPEHDVGQLSMAPLSALVEGQVLNFDGQPLSSASVELFVADAPGAPGSDDGVEIRIRFPTTAFTDRHGRFFVADEGGRWPEIQREFWSIHVRASGHLPSGPIPFLRGERGLLVELEEVSAVRGQLLVDPDIDPSQLLVVVQPESGTPQTTPRRVAHHDGSFEVLGAPYRDATLEIRDARLSTSLHRVEGIFPRPASAPPETVTVDLRNRLRPVRIEVLDASGSPAMDAHLHQLPSTPNEDPAERALGARRVRGSAPFEFYSTESADYLVGAPGYRTQRLEAIHGDTTATLAPAFQISVELVDPPSVGADRLHFELTCQDLGLGVEGAVQRVPCLGSGPVGLSADRIGVAHLRVLEASQDGRSMTSRLFRVESDGPGSTASRVLAVQVSETTPRRIRIRLESPEDD